MRENGSICPFSLSFCVRVWALSLSNAVVLRAIWGAEKGQLPILPPKHYPINSENFKSGNGNSK